MSTMKEKIIALFAAEETPPVTPASPLGYLPGEAPPVTPPAQPPVTPPPVEPVQPPVPPVTPPAMSVEDTLAEALRIQKAELEAGFKEKLKGITSNTTPPPAIPPEVPEVSDGVDFDKWNKKISEINNRLSNQN